MAKIIQPNGSCRIVQPANGTDFSLDEMQKIVGGNIELVYLNDTEIMVVNEEGKIDGLEYNAVATSIFKNNHPGTDDFIVGIALVCAGAQIK